MATSTTSTGDGARREGEPGSPEPVGPPAAPCSCGGRVVDEVGHMDPSYFLYWEETEWTLRFKEAGHLVGFVPQASATHFRQLDDRRIGFEDL